MKTEFRGSFRKDLRNIQSREILASIRDCIRTVETASSLQDITHVKPLRGHSGYYRIRVGDYRIGLLLGGDSVQFVRCLHRREIYRYFP